MDSQSDNCVSAKVASGTKVIKKVKNGNLFSQLFDLENGYIHKKNLTPIPRKHSFIEVFDKDKLKLIVDNLDKIMNSIEREGARNLPILERYLLSSEGCSEKKVIYDQKENGLYGRYQARNSVSGQGMIREVRHTIYNDFYLDLDIVNCHPVIIRWLCINLGMEANQYKNLDIYINQRDMVFDELMKANPNKDKDFFKSAILSMNNGGERAYQSISHKTKFIKDYYSEIKLIREKITSTFWKFKDLAEESSKSKDKMDDGLDQSKDEVFNLLGKTMAHICIFVENQLLMKICEYFKKKDKDSFKHSILCFDGLMITKDLGLNIDVCISDLEKIFKKYKKYIKT